MNALQHLCLLTNRRKAHRYPNVPAQYIPRNKYTDRDAKSLTRCIVDWFSINNHFVTRLVSAGTYRTDLQTFVPSQQRAGLANVLAVVEGRAVFVVIKHRDERPSDISKQFRLAQHLSLSLRCLHVSGLL